MMIDFNKDQYKLQKRTVNSVLKKLHKENEINENHRYPVDLAIEICEYILKKGTANNKMSASLCLTEIKLEKERQIEIERNRKPIIKHEIRNKHYQVKDYDNIDYCMMCIKNDKIVSEYEYLYGYSLIAKEYAVIGALELYPKKDKKTIECVNNILLKYSNITRHMREESLNFEDIASRYSFLDTLKILPTIHNILITEYEE